MELSDALAAAVDAVGPSVLRVEGRCALATATVWGDDVALTALHAIGRHEAVTVTGDDGVARPATVVGRDPQLDLAVLRVEGGGLRAPAWSEGDAVKVGHLALAVGRPGRSARTTMGVVSAVGRDVRTPSGARLDRYFEVDAHLPRGFSGGPLVDAAGAVLGMNTAAVMRGGATIPTATLRAAVTELLTHGKRARGRLGVQVYPVRLPDAAAGEGGAHGVVIVAVESDSPAAKHGLRVGDLVLAIDGHTVADPADLMGALAGRAGVEVDVTVWRNGARESVKVLTAAR